MEQKLYVLFESSTRRTGSFEYFFCKVSARVARSPLAIAFPVECSFFTSIFLGLCMYLSQQPRLRERSSWRLAGVRSRAQHVRLDVDFWETLRRRKLFLCQSVGAASPCLEESYAGNSFSVHADLAVLVRGWRVLCSCWQDNV